MVRIATLQGGFDPRTARAETGWRVTALSIPHSRSSGRLNRRDLECPEESFLAQVIAKEDDSAEDDRNDQIRGQSRIHELWKYYPCEEFPRVLEGCDADAKKEAQPGARGVASEMKEMPSQKRQKPYRGTDYQGKQDALDAQSSERFIQMADHLTIDVVE